MADELFASMLLYPCCFQLNGDGSRRPSMCYPFTKTPIEGLADLGVGIGMYVNMLKLFAIILFWPDRLVLQRYPTLDLTINFGKTP